MDTMRFAAIVLALVACGRLGFDRRAVDGGGGGSGRGSDAAIAIDAPMLCMPLGSGETVAMCSAAFASPGTASDQLVYDCAHSCVLGRCAIHDGCGTCACTAYAWSSTICDAMTSTCGAPLSGTGCVGFNYYAGPPFNCPSTGNLVQEGACILRVLVAMGDC